MLKNQESIHLVQKVLNEFWAEQPQQSNTHAASSSSNTGSGMFGSWGNNSREVNERTHLIPQQGSSYSAGNSNNFQ